MSLVDGAQTPVHTGALDTNLIRVLDEVVEADEASHRCALDTDLIRVLNEVIEADEACDELAVDEVVSFVDCAQTPVHMCSRY